MNRKLKVYSFQDRLLFALAKDIEDYAVSKGWRVKVDCNGQRHPGTICNEHIKRLLNSNNLRRHFNWHSFDVVSIHTDDPMNYSVISDLVEQDIINYSTIKHGYLDLYNLNAVRMIISCMIQDINFEIPEEDIVIDDSYREVCIHMNAHKWDTKKLKTKPLFAVVHKAQSTGKTKLMQSFLEANFNEEEKAAIRKYQRLIRETRQNGTRPYIKRSTFKEEVDNG